MIRAELKILIVDDDDADAALLTYELQGIPMANRVRRANSRESFVRELARRPDLILTDFSMPGFGAIEVLRIVREAQVNIPVIIISGTIGEDTAVEAMKHGAVDYLLKDRLTRLGPAIERVFEHIQLNRERQESEALLSMACRIGRIGAWAIELPEGKLMWSAEVRAIHEVATDYVPTLAEGMNFYAPEDRKTIQDAITACIETGAPYDLELQLVTARGRRIWVRAIGEAERDASGAIRRIQSALQDISDRMAAAEKTTQLAERLTTTLESITDAFFTVDSEWRFTYFNQEAERLLRRSRTGLLGKTLWTEFPELHGSTFEREYKRAVTENISVNFEDYYAPLGLWIEVRAYPSTQGLTVYFRDVSERRRVEEERTAALLRERAAREEAEIAKTHFRTLFELIPGLYLVLAPGDYRIVAVSEAYLRATMTTREGILGRCLFDVLPDDPAEPDADGARNLRASLERVKQTRLADTMALQRYPIRRPESEGGGFEERYWSPFNSPVLGPGGEVAYLIYRVEDVTEFVRMKQRAGAWEEGKRTLETKLERMEADLMLRAQEVLKLNEKLHLSEEQFRGMFLDAAAGIAVITPQQKFLQANPTFCATTGYTADELRDIDLPALIASQDRPSHDRAIQRLLAREISSTALEARFVRKGGALMWISASFSVVRTTSGAPQHLVAVIEDITDRRQAQLALQEREEHYRLLFTRNPQPMWVFDLETKRFLAVNPAAIEKYGYTEDEFLSMTIEDIRPADDIPKLRDSWRTLDLAAKNLEVWRHRIKSGRIIDVEVAADTIHFGGRPARLVLVNDITERLQAEVRIAEQAALIDQANDAIIVRDLNHVIQFWSKGAERLYGWAAGEAIGERLNELVGQRFDQFTEATRLLPQAGDWVGELEHTTKDGRTIVVSAHWSLLRGDEGQPKAILAIMGDITERKKIEAQFLRAQRLESIGTLAGGIAHDLNNLLAPIVMGVGLLKMSSSLAPGDRAVIDTIERSAERGRGLVRQVLSFARGVEGSRVTLHVQHLVDEIELIVSDTFPKNVRFTKNIAADIGLITGDPTQLNQVLLNLCVNARDAMPAGGRLTIGAKNELFDEQYAATHRGASPGRYVVIEVADTGTGIPKEIIDKIFEPFFTTKELGQGTGLGLATTLGIVRSHGGFMNVYSEVGNGTVVKVYLPLRTEASEGTAAPEIKPVELPRGNGEWLLFADDEASIRSITRQTLEAFGYHVIVAEDGADAIGQFVANRERVALLITDLMMPVMDGYALIAAVRRLAFDLPIIATSGLQAHAEVAKAANAGVRHFITKPFSADTLLKNVRTVLDEKARLSSDVSPASSSAPLGDRYPSNP